MTTELLLSARPPFSLPAVVDSHGWAKLAPFSRNESPLVLAYVAQLGSGQIVDIRIQEAPGGVRVAWDDELEPAQQTEIASMVTWMLALDQDLTTFYTLAREEARLAKAEAQAQGRILRSPTLFEDTVKTILTTNTSWTGTIRMVQALVTQFGSPLPGNPAHRAFPTPQQLALSEEETLRSSARLGYRAPYVLELARDVVSGRIDLESLRIGSMPIEQLRNKLLAIRGVGGYAAANLLMILGRFDYLPVDSWAFKMVSHEWYGGKPVGQAEVEAAFEPWGEWKGLAFWFWDWSYFHSATET